MSEKTYNLTLTMQELTVLGRGLSSVPYGDAKPVIDNIEKQVNAQMEEKLESPEGKPFIPEVKE